MSNVIIFPRQFCEPPKTARWFWGGIKHDLIGLATARSRNTGGILSPDEQYRLGAAYAGIATRRAALRFMCWACPDVDRFALVADPAITEFPWTVARIGAYLEITPDEARELNRLHPEQGSGTAA